jgi:hypothetical protein
VSAGWTAASVRARALARRRVGTEGARSLARLRSLDDARARLDDSPYAGRIGPSMGVAEIQHALWSEILWELRILAAWAPPGGAHLARLLAAGFEISNVESQRLWMEDGVEHPMFDLGALGRVWGRAARAVTPGELRSLLARSVWGDPGGESWWDVHLGLRLSWARQLQALGPPASGWAAGAVALMVAARLDAGEALSSSQSEAAAHVIGGTPTGVSTASDLARCVSPPGRWALEGMSQDLEVWRAQARWWSSVGRDAATILAGPAAGPRSVVAAVAAMAVDAWRVSSALEVARRGAGEEVLEEFDAVA